MPTSTEISRLLQAWNESERQASDQLMPQRPKAASRNVGSSRWNKILGPFFDPSEAARFLGGISQQALADRARQHQVLELETADGHRVYPGFQFDSRGNGNRARVLAGLPEILETLASSGIDDWSLAGWLMSAMESLEGRTPIEWLRSGEDPNRLMSVARAAAQRFAQ